eukprot:185609_1
MGNVQTKSNSDGSSDIKILQMYSQLINMGFDENICLEAAHKCTTNINEAIEYVLKQKNHNDQTRDEPKKKQPYQSVDDQYNDHDKNNNNIAYAKPQSVSHFTSSCYALDVAQECKQDNKFEEKYGQLDFEECVNQEVIVNDNDLRIKVLESDDRDESIMQCIGYLKSDYIYDSNGGYRKSTAGTATAFYVGSNGKTFIVSCAHNVRTLVRRCNQCQ